MSVPAANGFPQMGTTSTSGLGSIPVKFASKTIMQYYAASHLAACCNTDYEGEIKQQGDTVRIRSIPRITTSTHTKGANLGTHEVPVLGTQDLLIDQAQKYNFLVDAIDAKQHDIVLSDRFTEAAGKDMRESVEGDAIPKIALTAHALNQGATAGKKSASYNLGATGAPVAVTKTNVIEFLTAHRAVLAEQNADNGTIWMLIPMWMRWLLINSDLKNASLTGDSKSILRNGQIGEIDGMKILASNLMKNYTDGSTGGWDVLCGNMEAITWAAQMTENRSIQDKDYMGTFYQGIYVYGYKTVRPEALVRGYCYKGT